jgi:muconolactone D-isomerase
VHSWAASTVIPHSSPVLASNEAVGTTLFIDYRESHNRVMPSPLGDEGIMEFLVEFEVNVPAGAPEDEVEHRENAEASAAARLAKEGHLVRLWKLPAARGQAKAVGLFRAGSTAQLDGLLDALPLADWIHVKVTRLASHPNDPVGAAATA